MLGGLETCAASVWSSLQWTRAKSQRDAELAACKTLEIDADLLRERGVRSASAGALDEAAIEAHINALRAEGGIAEAEVELAEAKAKAAHAKAAIAKAEASLAKRRLDPANIAATLG